MSGRGQMPPKLERIERLLSGDARPTPPAALRERLLGGVRTELRRRRRRRGLRYAVSAAAVLLALAGFSASAVWEYRSARHRSASPPTLSNIEQPRDLSAGFLWMEWLRQAMQTRSGAKAESRADSKGAINVEFQSVEPNDATSEHEEESHVAE